MKTLLIALALVGANVMACPDAAKEAAAVRADRPAVAVAQAKPQALRASAKTTKVAVKPSTEVRKPTTL